MKSEASAGPNGDGDVALGGPALRWDFQNMGSAQRDLHNSRNAVHFLHYRRRDPA